MSKAIGQSSSCCIVADNGRVYDFCFIVDPTHGSNLLEVRVSVGGVEVGTPIRFKGAGGRIAADLPGVDAGSFIVDSGDHITNG